MASKRRRSFLQLLLVALLGRSAVAQLQFDELPGRGLPLNHHRTQCLAHGDVDGDGLLDLVLGHDWGQTRLYLNDGAGGFRDATTRLPADGQRIFAVVLVDVDGDTDLDLVLGNCGFQNRLYLNTGGGFFRDATASQMPVDLDSTLSIVAGDVDLDGDPDLILANQWEPSRVYLNDGTGTFGATSLPGTSWGTCVALGDVDRDGDLDLALGVDWSGLHRNRLYLNDGSGTFNDASRNCMPLTSDRARSLAFGDVDQDGDLDLVVGNRGQWDEDVPIGQQTRLYLNQQDARPAPSGWAGVFVDATERFLPVDADYSNAVELGDVDGDGDLDLFVGNGACDAHWLNGSNRLYLNTTDRDAGPVGEGGVFLGFVDASGALPREAETPTATTAVALVDPDGDGDLDILTATDGWQDRYLVNRGDGTYHDATRARLSLAPSGAKAVVTGDVDGDGYPDVLFATGRLILHRNNGRATFQDVTEESFPDAGVASAGDVALVDVDGDDDLDVVLANCGPNRLYLNDGSGVYVDDTGARLPGHDECSAAIGVGDVDADGDLDLILANRYGQQNRLLLNDGSGVYVDETSARLPPDGDDSNSVTLGDVDGDGDLDLAFGNGLERGGAQQSRLYFNDGAGFFSDVTRVQMPIRDDATFAIVFGDVDRDGDLDLILGNEGQDRLYLNDGSGLFSDATKDHLPVDETIYTRDLVLADIDGNGGLDIVFCDEREGSRLYLDDGAGAYHDASASRLPGGALQVAVALADLDRDDDLDIVFAQLNDECTLHSFPIRPWHDRILLNLRRQLDAPYLAHVGSTYRFDVHARWSRPGLTAVAIPFVSMGTASIPTPFGIFGLDPTTLVMLPPVVIPQPAGTASVVVSIPDLPGIDGLPFYAQALIATNPLPPHLTNVAANVLFR